MRYNWSEALKSVINYAENKLKLNIIDDIQLDQYFKGDMDGLNIITSSLIDDEEELFNILHMIGHCIQWNVDDELRKLGNVLYTNPSDRLLRKLQEYEWEANCYALSILHNVKIYNLDIWLYDCYIKDMYYLTHFYKTGEKVKEITSVSIKYSYTKLLYPKEIPPFTPVAGERSRSGIVISF